VRSKAKTKSACAAIVTATSHSGKLKKSAGRPRGKRRENNGKPTGKSGSMIRTRTMMRTEMAMMIRKTGSVEVRDVIDL
jgi:hypothetical protein